MVVTKLLVAFGIGIVYSLLSVGTLIVGTSAIVRRGVRGGIVAGSGAALGFCFYAAVAIVGLGMVQYFLRPIHLAILETVLGLLFVGTGAWLLVRRRKPKRKAWKSISVEQEELWPFFVANLSLILSGPQKTAYFTGLFLFFNLHITSWMVKAAIPVAVLLGSFVMWVSYSIIVAKNWQRITELRLVQHNLERLHHLSRGKVFAHIRRSMVNKQVVRYLLQLVRILMVGIGLFLIGRGGFVIVNACCGK